MSRSPFIRRVASKLSHFLTRFPDLHQKLRRCFLGLPPNLRGPVIVHDAFRDLAANKGDVYFVQIGANDGDQSDPLHHFVRSHEWRGILVEPVPIYFKELKKNYGSCKGLAFENIAISDETAERDFFFLEDPADELPEWARGLGSFFRDEVSSARIPGKDPEDYLKSIRVPCLTFVDLLARHQQPGVDLVIIDAQGFDAEIIKQLDLSAIQPQVIVFEHILLAAEDKAAACAKLQDAGYQLREDRWDVVASLRPRPCS